MTFTGQIKVTLFKMQYFHELSDCSTMWGEYGSCSQIGSIKGKYDEIRLNRGEICT